MPNRDDVVAFISREHVEQWAIDEGLSESQAFDESLDVLLGYDDIDNYLLGKPYLNARKRLDNEGGT